MDSPFMGDGFGPMDFNRFVDVWMLWDHFVMCLDDFGWLLDHFVMVVQSRQSLTL